MTAVRPSDDRRRLLHRQSRSGLRGMIARRYVSGRTRDWLKFKNPVASALRRELSFQLFVKEKLLSI
jgi:hypothetical protein